MTPTTHLPGDLESVRRVLDEATTMVLATRMPDGTPRATPVYFATDDRLRLIFLSDPNSVHSRNLAALSSASAAVYPDERDWRKLRGVQVMGQAHMLDGPEAEAARHTFGRRFPFVTELAAALTASRIYALAPSWIRLIDNRRGFGFQQEWSLG